MALLYDLREMLYKGKPIWKRVIENIIDLSKQVDALSGSESSSMSSVTSKLTELEGRIEALEDDGGSS